MKHLSENELIELIAPTPLVLERGLASFEVTAPILCREVGYLKQLVSEGWVETKVVVVNGEPAYLIGWHITPDQGFWFDFVVTLGSAASYQACVVAIERLAHEKKCRYVRWVTLRRGIAKWAKEQGYTAEAVILTKKLL